MKRGDVVIVAEGKPRPAVVVQSDTLPTPVEVLICPITSTLVDAPIYRLQVEPNAANGLKVASQVMIDKVAPARLDRIGAVIGRLNPDELAKLDAALLALLDIGKD